MLKHLETDKVSSWVLIGVGLVLIEILFFSSGMLFSLFLAAVLLYLGRKKFNRFLGKVMFGIGVLTLVLTILSMFTLKLLLIFLIIYWIQHYFKSKNEPNVITPVIEGPVENPKTEVLTFHRQQLLVNKWIGHQQTPQETYAWEDIQLQNGVGDVLIDLSNTVLPVGESVISIRSGIGKVTILIPYELDIGIRHTAIVGSASILNYQSTRLWNESVSFHSEDYFDAPQKVKILTSVWVGDLEVKRV